MNLIQLVYVSRATTRLTMPTLQEIVAHSAWNNARADVSGVLYAYGTSLMQLLEGDEQVIDALFAKISKDPRHTDVAALLRKPVKKRLFGEWGMGLCDVRSNLETDRARMARLIEEIRLANDTRGYSVEARVLLRDFQQQAAAA